jgi:hypothetical protein
MYLIAEIKQSDGPTVAVISLPAKEFKTGSKGFYGNTKIEIEGKRYQIQIQAVEIGSKPKEEKD